jgi:hypothetical protein
MTSAQSFKYSLTAVLGKQMIHHFADQRLVKLPGDADPDHFMLETICRFTGRLPSGRSPVSLSLGWAAPQHPNNKTILLALSTG